MHNILGRTRATEFSLLPVMLGLMILSPVSVNTAVGAPVYCFAAGTLNSENCEKAELGEGNANGRYHTLKVVVEKRQDEALLEEILPITRLGGLQQAADGRTIFLGKFRDSMKAHRVVESCQDKYPVKCARFAIQVITIRGELDELKPDLHNKASGDLVTAGDMQLGLSREAVLLASKNKPGSVVPRGLFKLPDNLEHVLWVDLQAGNLHVLERDDEQFRLTRTMSVSIGKAGYGKLKEGDKKTPVGVYRLLSFLTDEQLEARYGSGAYTLNYPNALDRIRQRDGSGIWLHGLPKGKDHRPLQDSDGCVVLSNTMFEDIDSYVNSQVTPIVLDDQFEWVSSEEQVSKREELEQTIEIWRNAWARIDNDSYLAHYADDFTNLEKDLATWIHYKKRIHARKKFIEVSISELSLIAYPSEQNMVLARFYQRYKSSDFRANGWKEQLWRKEDSGLWRIVYERG